MESLNIYTKLCYNLLCAAKFYLGVYMQDNHDQTYWAYIAGIMDADGCFMIFKHKRKTKNGNSIRAIDFPKHVDKWSISYIPSVKIAMVEREAIDLVWKIMGFGNMNVDKAREPRPYMGIKHNKPIYHWYLRNKYDCLRFLNGVLPYLRVKKDRALHLKKFSEHLIEFGNPCYKGLSKDELDYREDMYIKMREFNGNFVGATTNPSEHESASDSLIL